MVRYPSIPQDRPHHDRRAVRTEVSKCGRRRVNATFYDSFKIDSLLRSHPFSELDLRKLPFPCQWRERFCPKHFHTGCFSRFTFGMNFAYMEFINDDGCPPLVSESKSCVFMICIRSRVQRFRVSFLPPGFHVGGGLSYDNPRSLRCPMKTKGPWEPI
jgi:hypothetical protein